MQHFMEVLRGQCMIFLERVFCTDLNRTRSGLQMLYYLSNPRARVCEISFQSTHCSVLQVWMRIDLDLVYVRGLMLLYIYIC